jgi:hypothetical protein
MCRSRSKAVILSILIATSSWCQDKQALGEAMLNRARQASDIRATNAPAFHLRATFSFISENLETVAGTYSEWWVSNTQWRREAIVGDSRRIEIGGPDKRWLLDIGPSLPEQVRRLPALFEVIPPNTRKFEFESILDPAPDDSKVACALTVPGLEKQKSAFCFHKPSGVLIQKVEPYPLGRRVAGYSCNYASFHMFGNFSYPRDMACFIEGHRKIEAKVTDLAFEPSLDSALFNASPEAVELGTCSGKITPPKAVLTPDPALPWRATSDSSVILELVVDTKGSTESAGKSIWWKVVRPECRACCA